MVVVECENKNRLPIRLLVRFVRFLQSSTIRLLTFPQGIFLFLAGMDLSTFFSYPTRLSSRRLRESSKEPWVYAAFRNSYSSPPPRPVNKRLVTGGLLGCIPFPVPVLVLLFLLPLLLGLPVVLAVVVVVAVGAFPTLAAWISGVSCNPPPPRFSSSSSNALSSPVLRSRPSHWGGVAVREVFADDLSSLVVLLIGVLVVEVAASRLTLSVVVSMLLRALWNSKSSDSAVLVLSIPKLELEEPALPLAPALEEEPTPDRVLSRLERSNVREMPLTTAAFASVANMSGKLRSKATEEE